MLPSLAMMIALGMSSHVPFVDKKEDWDELLAKSIVFMSPTL